MMNEIETIEVAPQKMSFVGYLQPDDNIFDILEMYCVYNLMCSDAKLKSLECQSDCDVR